MESLASTAIYLASSLTVAQAPGTMASVATAATTMSADAHVAVNPFVAARMRGGKSLSQAIADEVRRDAIKRPSADADGSFDPDQDAHDDESLVADITAAHDARIAVIQQRINEARLAGPSAAPQIEMLGAKLRMAMAARRLAVAREAIGYLPADCAATEACGPVPIAVAATAVTEPRGTGHGRPRRSAASHRRSPAGIAVAAARPVPSGRIAPTASRSSPKAADRMVDGRGDPTHRASGRESIAAGSAFRPAVRGAARHRSIEAVVVDGSDHARRLLAAARRLLEDDASLHASGKAGHDPHSAARLAGLLHWEGSETWSLASYPKSSA